MAKPAATESNRRRRKSHKSLDPFIDEALRIRERAYAPYSRFQVGAALVGESGRVYLGCNVENSAYGLALCAERAAVAAAVGQGETKFQGLVIATPSDPPSPPCGMCRQTLAEFAADLPIVLVNDRGARVDTTLAELFPRSFTREYL